MPQSLSLRYTVILSYPIIYYSRQKSIRKEDNILFYNIKQSPDADCSLSVIRRLNDSQDPYESVPTLIMCLLCILPGMMDGSCRMMGRSIYGG